MTGDDGREDGNGARSEGDRRTGPRRAVVKAAGLTLAGLLALGSGAAGWAYWHLNGNIDSVDINGALGDDRPAKPTPGARPVRASSPSAVSDAAPPSEPPLASEALNILVLGSDSRSGAENQRLGGGSSTGARSDTAMVVHLDAGRRSATVVSIPRDTLVTRPSCPLPSGGDTAVAYRAMFNSAYAVGGPVCAVKTVESLTGVRMDHYVEIDFAGFAKLVDALGGVTVTTEENIDDDLSHLRLDAGTHHLDGTRALALARTRHGLGDGSDLGRIGLQQQLVKALLARLGETELLTDPARLYAVADTVTGSLTTDTGLDSLTELIGLGQSLRDLPADDVTTVMVPVIPAPGDPNRVVADEPETGELWESLR